MPPPKKRLGQHFLHDPRILRRIADAATIQPGDTVLEIGPGPGGLTRELAAQGAGAGPARLVVIEKDRDMVPGLREQFPRVSVIEGDALELDWHRLTGPGPVRIVGNIPYNITSPLLERALLPPRPAVIVFLVQQEVADRVAAARGGPDYGALSVGVQAVARVERLFRVPAGAFRPRPKVDSAVLRLTPLSLPLVEDGEVPAFRRFVVGLFGFRRKQLIRGLRELTGAGAPEVARWLALAGVAESDRPQALDPASFARLFRAVPPLQRPA
ncbi:MAG TPA: 16S rRNA (adenine(1518)-N(6)/adenine(1519)-N(6))-dimethyltransferase RsmA [Gemmatimonadales bacterium]|nr:16S rRNA (adenine(1518)-N(6)/adenine(1519)-N(6))-dimethyltransferase RsmA [Gemmatimonadales bacterium]